MSNITKIKNSMKRNPLIRMESSEVGTLIGNQSTINKLQNESKMLLRNVLHYYNFVTMCIDLFQNFES